jgi:hypothetical protein
MQRFDAPQANYKACALSQLRACPYLALMGLNYLINDRQTETGAPFKIRLKGLKDFFCLLRVNPRAGVGKAHLPLLAALG